MSPACIFTSVMSQGKQKAAPLLFWWGLGTLCNRRPGCMCDQTMSACLCKWPADNITLISTQKQRSASPAWLQTCIGSKICARCLQPQQAPSLVTSKPTFGHTLSHDWLLVLAVCRPVYGICHSNSAQLNGGDQFVFTGKQSFQHKPHSK